MSDIQTDPNHSKKETSGLWILLVFVILFALVVVLGTVTQ